MRTQFIPEQALGLPWLEHFPAKGGPAEKTILDKSPFIIGRGESADLQVVSHGVSREHAAVVREGRATRIRDLGSTNGTFVNGQRIKEVELHDGDMVQVANVEFAFYCGKSQARQATVTQVLALDGDAIPTTTARIAAIRRATSAARVPPPARNARDRLRAGSLEADRRALARGRWPATESSDEDVPPAGPEGNPLLPAIPGRVAARLRHLRRMRGVEQAAAMPGELLDLRTCPGRRGRRRAAAGIGRHVLRAAAGSETPGDRRALLRRQRRASQASAPGGRLRELGAAVALTDLGGQGCRLGPPGGDTSRFRPPGCLAGPRHSGQCR